ncbi:hypothetical protein CISIN_1g038644mg [Citrus sinensis]|uniref:Uncharacterized protein n=1 Tax=Citrus sinensis TaxID=2711 RepID=A0A067FDE1_CITSI|nr:hypothetical protein CISIN_1g038644mg [Citrus sinensis]
MNLRTGREKDAAMVSTLGKNSEFAEVNIGNEGSLLMALRGEIIPLILDMWILFVAAGPYQQALKCTVLEAAIETKCLGNFTLGHLDLRMNNLHGRILEAVSKTLGNLSTEAIIGHRDGPQVGWYVQGCFSRYLPGQYVKTDPSHQPQYSRHVITQQVATDDNLDKKKQLN